MKLPFNLFDWIKDNRELLKPPVGNQQLYIGNKDFIVMIVGGPNSRKDYHVNNGEELFFQLQGDITLKIIEEGQPKDVSIKEGEMYLLSPNIPHSPQRPAETVGLVIERYRKEGELDAFEWYCESCNHKLYKESFPLTDIVKQLPVVMRNYYDSEAHRTCDECGTLMQKPA